MQRKFDFSDLNEEEKEKPKTQATQFDFSDLNQDKEKTSAKEKEPSFLSRVISNTPQAKIAKAGGILGGDILEAVKNGALTAAAGAPDVPEQIMNEPGRFGKNVGRGFIGLTKKLLNVPHGMPEFLAHLGLAPEEGAKKVGSYIPEFEEKEDIKQFYGKPISEADKLVTGLLENADFIIPGAKAILKSGRNATGSIAKVEALKSQLEGKSSNLESAKTAEQEVQFEAGSEAGAKTAESLQYKRKQAEMKLNRLNEMKENPEVSPEQLSQAEEAYAQSNSDFLTAKAQAKGKFGVNSEYSLQDRLNTAKTQLSDLQKSVEEHPPTTEEEILKYQEESQRANAEYTEAKNAAEQTVKSSNPNSLQYKINELDSNLAKTDEEIAKLNKTKAPNIEESKTALENATKTHQEAVKINDQVDHEVGNFLKKGDEHDVDVARRAKEKLEANSKDIGKALNTFKANLEGKNIVIDNTADVKRLTDDFNKLIQESEGNIKTPEIQEAGKKLLEASKKEIIPAKDFVSMYQAVGQYVREANKKAYKVGRSEEEHKLWKARADEAEIKLDEIEKVLESNLGKEEWAQFQKDRGRWRTEQVPLYGEPLYWQIMNKERLSSTNMMGELRGGKKGSGLEIIRNTIMNDPESVKNVIGQKFEAQNGSGKVYNPNKQMQGWIDRLPELKTYIGQKAEAQGAAAKAENAMSEVKSKHAETEKQHKVAEQAKIDKEKKETERAEKEKKRNLLEKFKEEVETKKAKAVEAEKIAKEKAEQVKEKTKITDQIKEFENKIPEMEKHLDTIKQTEIVKLKSEKNLKETREKKSHDEKVKQKLMDNKKDLQETIKNADKYIPKLREAKRNTKLAAEEVKQIEKALKKAEAIKAKSWKKLIIVGGLLSSYAGVKSIYNKSIQLLGD